MRVEILTLFHRVNTYHSLSIWYVNCWFFHTCLYQVEETFLFLVCGGNFIIREYGFCQMIFLCIDILFSVLILY